MAAELMLAELRKAFDVSQEELAKILDVKQANVSKIERREDMRLSTLVTYICGRGTSPRASLFPQSSERSR